MKKRTVITNATALCVLLSVAFTFAVSAVSAVDYADLRTRYSSELIGISDVETHGTDEMSEQADKYKALEQRVFASLKSSLSADKVKALNQSQNAWNERTEKDADDQTMRFIGMGPSYLDGEYYDIMCEYSRVRTAYLISQLGKPSATRNKFAQKALALDKQSIYYGDHARDVSDKERMARYGKVANGWVALRGEINAYLAKTSKAQQAAKRKTDFDAKIKRKIADEKEMRMSGSESEAKIYAMIKNYPAECCYLISMID